MAVDVAWISVKMSYNWWQITWELQKTKWSICKRIGFSPLHSIVQPVILFLSEWKKFQIMFGVGVFLMSHSQEWNFSFWQEDRDALIAYFFVAYFLTHQQFINEVSLTLADGYFKTSKEKKTTVLYHGIFRCPFFTSGVVCFFYCWWFYLLWWSSNDNDYMFFFLQATNVLDRCVFGYVWIICLGT